MMVLGTYELWSGGDRNSTSWPGLNGDSGFALCDLSKFCF